MTKFNELSTLMLEFLDDFVYYPGEFRFSNRELEIINEISDFVVKTSFFQEYKKRGEIFESLTVEQLFLYLLDRISHAPTFLHRDMSIFFIMPFLREKILNDKK